MYMRKEQETKTWEINSQTLERKSKESGMPRIDGTPKSKRLENPGQPHWLPAACHKEAFHSHGLFCPILENSGKSWKILENPGQLHWLPAACHKEAFHSHCLFCPILENSGKFWKIQVSHTGFLPPTKKLSTLFLSYIIY